MITRHIADLLYDHECVIVPGLGGFLKAYHPARILHTTHEFRPPCGTVAFNAGLSGNDGQLASYISKVDGISYREALYKIKLWVDECLDAVKKGDRVVLEGIGDIFLNNSGNLEYIPTKLANFNADSFGLPVFYATASGNDKLSIPDIHPSKRIRGNAKYHRIIPETLKWAAVLAPFIAFGFWSTFNATFIDNYVHNYTGIYSWVRSTPGKSASVNSVSLPYKTTETAGVEVIESPAAILASQNIPFDPGMVSYSELEQNKISISDPDVIAASAENTAIQDFFIIGGAFRDQNNADKLINILQEQGYPAAIVDTTPGGLYIVSMKGFTDYAEAVTQLDEIKKAGFESSWILKKQRG